MNHKTVESFTKVCYQRNYNTGLGEKKLGVLVHAYNLNTTGGFLKQETPKLKPSMNN